MNKTIKVNLKGSFVKNFYKIKKGTKVMIDRICHDHCQSGIMCHLTKIIKYQDKGANIMWFDSDWFRFDK